MQTIDLSKIQNDLQSQRELKGSAPVPETGSPSSTEKSQQLKRQKLMEKLWLYLSELYGYKFSSQYGETPSPVWTRVLSDLSPEAIGYGIDNLETLPSENGYPPGALEFKKLCKAHHDRSPTGINHEAYRRHPSIDAPPPSDDKDYGRSQIAKIKAGLESGPTTKPQDSKQAS